MLLAAESHLECALVVGGSNHARDTASVGADPCHSSGILVRCREADPAWPTISNSGVFCSSWSVDLRMIDMERDRYLIRLEMGREDACTKWPVL